MADSGWYFNKWRVHWLRRAELAPEAVALADAICAGDLASEETARREMAARKFEDFEKNRRTKLAVIWNREACPLSGVKRT